MIDGVQQGNGQGVQQEESRPQWYLKVAWRKEHPGLAFIQVWFCGGILTEFALNEPSAKEFEKLLGMALYNSQGRIVQPVHGRLI